MRHYQPSPEWVQWCQRSMQLGAIPITVVDEDGHQRYLEVMVTNGAQYRSHRITTEAMHDGIWILERTIERLKRDLG